MMMQMIDGPQLEEIVDAKLPRESLGPDSDWPCIAINLETAKNAHTSWLRNLPCPIIGIGEGPLASHCDTVLQDKRSLSAIVDNIKNAPLAAMVLVQHLRASEALDIQDALTAESFAYATLQNGPEFQHWLNEHGQQKSTLSPSEPLIVNLEKGILSLTLNDSDNHNAIGASMRDALCEALDLALADETIEEVHLSANGRAFSTGGAVEEFGHSSDPATAHWVRSLRLPAWRCARLAEKLRVHVQGAAIGAGAEIAAFGHHVSATSDTWFQLPELKYGLIPGAGGTASIAKRIGRQRTTFMALSMKRIDAQTALEWDLIDEILS